MYYRSNAFNIRAMMNDGGNFVYANNMLLLILYEYLNIIQPKLLFFFSFFQESLITTCCLGERKVQSLFSVIYVTSSRKMRNDSSNLQDEFDLIEINCWMPLVYNSFISNVFCTSGLKYEVSSCLLRHMVIMSIIHFLLFQH